MGHSCSQRSSYSECIQIHRIEASIWGELPETIPLQSLLQSRLTDRKTCQEKKSEGRHMQNSEPLPSLVCIVTPLRSRVTIERTQVV